MNLEDMDTILTVKDVANFLKVSEHLVLKLIHQKELKALKVGRVYRITKEYLIQYLRQDKANSR